MIRRVLVRIKRESYYTHFTLTDQWNKYSKGMCIKLVVPQGVCVAHLDDHLQANLSRG